MRIAVSLNTPLRRQVTRSLVSYGLRKTIYIQLHIYIHKYIHIYVCLGYRINPKPPGGGSLNLVSCNPAKNFTAGLTFQLATSNSVQGTPNCLWCLSQAGSRAQTSVQSPVSWGLGLAGSRAQTSVQSPVSWGLGLTNLADTKVEWFCADISIGRSH